VLDEVFGKNAGRSAAKSQNPRTEMCWIKGTGSCSNRFTGMMLDKMYIKSSEKDAMKCTVKGLKLFR
jgi:hypothetical protein